MTENAIEAVNLSKSFRVPSERRYSLKERFVRGGSSQVRVFWALKDATFSVPKGSSLGLIGQNGSGKSTALKVLTGIYRPTSGQVTVNGSVSALLEVGAGFHPELTGRENIRLNATILGFTNREIDRLMDQIIEFADIGEHIDGPIKHYSSGMYVRLGFAVAVMVRPDVLLVDEVIAVGDEEFQRKCYDYLYELRRSGTSMIMVSHGLTQITDLCDDAVWLEQGHVMQAGASRGVVHAYLDSVNEREIQRDKRLRGDLDVSPVGAASGGSTVEFIDLSEDDLPVRPDRRGTGQMWVTGVEYLDEQDRVVGLLLSGRPATFRVHYRAEADVDGVTVAVGFENDLDEPLSGTNTGHLGTWQVPKGLGYIDFRTDPLLLAPGQFRFATRIHMGSRVLDEVEGGFPLTVRESEIATSGVFHQPGAWTLNARPLRPVG